MAGGRRDDSARTCRKILISTQVGGREPGDLGYRVMRRRTSWRSADQGAQNGRAAMLGIMAFSAAHFIPGSVPFFFNAWRVRA